MTTPSDLKNALYRLFSSL